MIEKNRLQKQKHSQGHFFIFTLALVAALSAGLSYFGPAAAAVNLAITPITWNVVGLDSNDVSVGPNTFPVGVRVCNPDSVAANNVQLTFVWDTPNDLYINLRPGSFGSPAGTAYNIGTLNGNGACIDIYYEVEIPRNSSAYDQTRAYHITATADGLGTSSTPTSREIFVEHLVSQSRNYNFDVKLDNVSIPAGGSMNLFVGQTYTIELISKTATQGYEQIESFINFPNTIFQILSVASSYSAATGGGTTPTTTLYNNACNWENDLTNLNYYRSCLGVGKAGGDVTNTYMVKILSTAAVGSQTLYNLVYDFSGSSYHYNSDYATSFRIANIIDPASVTIDKNFSPDPTNVNGISTLTFTLYNPNTAVVNGANFTDTLPTTPLNPGSMEVAIPSNATTSECGTPTLTASGGLIIFRNGTIAAQGYCVIKVNVTVPATGTYSNTTSHLFIGTVDTGDTASDTLTVNNAPQLPPEICGLPAMAQWTVPRTATVPPDTTGGNATIYASDVATRTAWAGNGYETNIAINKGYNDNYSWYANGGTTTGPVFSTDNMDYFAFQIDTSKYTNITLNFWALRKNKGPTDLYIYYGTSGTLPGSMRVSFTGTNGLPNFGVWKNFTVNFTGLTSTTGSTYFYIYGANSALDTPGTDFHLDLITFSGCKTPRNPPTISKSFLPNPAAVNGTSTLSFIITNPNPDALSGIRFSDVLPTGLTVASGSSPFCGGTLTTTAPNIISFTGGNLSASSSCTMTVTVTATTFGPHQNVSGFIYATESYTNTTTTGLATASLTTIRPPQISKWFSPTPILTGGISTLTFAITNPNLDYPLTGVAFNDDFTLMSGDMRVADPTGASTSGCGTAPTPTYAPVAVAGSISFSNGTILAGGTCIVTVDVTATTTGTYSNTSGTVSATIAGNGNTASGILVVEPVHPKVSILKSISTTSTGPWTPYVAVTPDTDIWYRLIVENSGDVPLTNIAVADPALGSLVDCVWDDMPLYDVQTCVVGPVTTGLDPQTNTATAQGMYSGTVYFSTPSTAKYDIAPADYDDLPDSYKTLRGSNGARHIKGSLFMGSDVTDDPDGKPSDTASSDDADDGVTRRTALWTNGATVELVIDLRTSFIIGTIDVGIWIDWNHNNAFDPATDFYPCTGLTTGDYRTCQIKIPDSGVYTVGQPVCVRVRIFDHNYLLGPELDAADYVGVATNGEVEAYKWYFDPTSVDLVTLQGRSAASPQLPLMVIAMLGAAAICLAWLLIRRKHI